MIANRNGYFVVISSKLFPGGEHQSLASRKDEPNEQTSRKFIRNRIIFGQEKNDIAMSFY